MPPQHAHQNCARQSQTLAGASGNRRPAEIGRQDAERMGEHQGGKPEPQANHPGDREPRVYPTDAARWASKSRVQARRGPIATVGPSLASEMP